MSWIFILATAAGIILKFLTSPPSALVGWILNKFEVHPKLEAKNITITFNGNRLKKEEENKFIDSFNEAQFLYKNHIFPGNEELFLHPETSIIPHIIYFKKKAKEITWHVYSYGDQVDVVKQQKKKITSYTLESKYIQSLSLQKK